MSCHGLGTLNAILTGGGLLLGVVGSLLMANGYFQISRPGAWVKILAGSLWKSDLAEGVSRTKNANPEDVTLSLRGIAFLALSFLLQLGAFAVQLMSSSCSPR